MASLFLGSYILGSHFWSDHHLTFMSWKRRMREYKDGSLFIRRGVWIFFFLNEIWLWIMTIHWIWTVVDACLLKLKNSYQVNQKLKDVKTLTLFLWSYFSSGIHPYISFFNVNKRKHALNYLGFDPLFRALIILVYLYRLMTIHLIQPFAEAISELGFAKLQNRIAKNFHIT